MEKDAYTTIARPTREILYKDKKSKFFGYVYPITSEAETKTIVAELRKVHPTAGHVCYAWQLGIETVRYRANDDGEPTNSAGMPIYGQIKAFGYTNILVAVPRIYGGTKLGVGGLIQAYKTAAQLALTTAVPVEKYLEVKFKINFDYPQMDRVMRLIKQRGLNIVHQKLELSCEVVVSTRKKNKQKLLTLLNELHEITYESLDNTTL